MAKQSFLHCSFCGRSRDEVKILIAGQEDVHICENCVESAKEIIGQELQVADDRLGVSKTFNENAIKKPREIKSYLDQYVVGQHEAKKILAVAVYNHYKRLGQKQLLENEVEIEKSNVILIGETGTGKTLLAKTIAKLLNVPFAIVDATVFTEAGYVGEDVESILTRLLQVCDYNVEMAEKGIVYIDEIDKIGRKSDNPSLTRDIKEGVQQAMLKLLEGSDVLVPPQGGRKHPEQKMIKVNTQNILFIAGGSFDGIEKIIAKRINTNSIGFNVNKELQEYQKKNLLPFVNMQDLRAFGLIPELLGRLPVIASLDPLDAETLKNILIDPKNSLVKQYSKLFEIEGVKLVFEDAAFDYIVSKSLEYKLGARGLRSICEHILNDAMFELPTSKQKEFRVTFDYAKAQIENNKIRFLKVA